jgi:hypothetical protein
MSSIIELAPIILLVYNRPEHARKTLESLMANDKANESKLFIYADGPKPNSTPEQLEKIQETRSVIKEKQWCKEVYIIELEENLGVDEATIKHVTDVVNKYGKVIVLEDDIVTSKGFLNFMNEALTLYENKENVYGISGYMFPINEKKSDILLIEGSNNPWGWATWRRAWANFNPDYKALIEQIGVSKDSIYAFNYEDTYDYYKMLSNSTDNNKPWDIRWYASVFLKKGLSVWAGQSLVQNIGHDATGEHCGVNDKYWIKNLAETIEVVEVEVKSNKRARNAIKKFNRSLNKVAFTTRLKWRISSFLPEELKKIVKRLLSK